MPAEDWHQRHDDAEADEVNEDRQENDEQRWLAVHVFGGAKSSGCGQK